MSNTNYNAYSMATRTVAKTRQVVMLYEGIIKFLKQAEVAITEGRIEDRFNLLSKAAEIIVGLQSSIDFENGGNIASTLHNFYSNMSMRILAINFVKEPEKAKQDCEELIGELKQMRDTWENIDKNLAENEVAAKSEGFASLEQNVILSA